MAGWHGLLSKLALEGLELSWADLTRGLGARAEAGGRRGFWAVGSVVARRLGSGCLVRGAGVGVIWCCSL